MERPSPCVGPLPNAAFELAATKGMADVTVNKVSELADITKRAVFHHFDSKETLLTELMQMLLTRLDNQLDRLMAEEETSDGCFSRAYIRAAFSEAAAERKFEVRSELSFAQSRLLPEAS